MKNKGFTLIELLGVIIILALLMLLVMPNIINSLKGASNDVDNLTLEMIYNAADLYMDEYIEGIEIENGDSYCVELTTLVNEGYLKSPININDRDITNSNSVKAVYNKGFSYELVESNECSS